MSDLSERYRGAEPLVALATPDGNNILDFYQGQVTHGRHTIITYHCTPTMQTDPYQSDVRLLRVEKEILGKALERDETFVVNAGANSTMVEFTRADQHVDLLKALGYDWHMAERQVGGYRHRWIELHYPTTQTLNAVLDELSPGEGLRFIDYAEGRYEAEEYIEAFVDGQMLVGEKQPYQVHDHISHLLGYIGLSGEFLSSLQDFAKAYLDRYHAELTLPTVPGMELRAMTDFLRPSRKVLGAILRALDGYSNIATYEALHEDAAERDQTKFYDAVSGIYTNLGGRMGEIMPSRLFSEPEPEIARGYALDIDNRFRQMEERAAERDLA